MALIIGLDIGSTKLAAVAYETETANVVATAAVPNSARRDSVVNGLTRAELDVAALDELAEGLLHALVATLPDAEDVAGIGVTGQQHGLAWLDDHGRPAGPAITWQDQRALERTPSGTTYLAQMVAAAGGAERFHDMGCQPAPGYLGVTLYWLAQHGALPANAQASFVPDAVVAHLIGCLPPTDPTMAGSSALYDVAHGRWDRELLTALGLGAASLPEVMPTGSAVGGLCPTAAVRCGLRAGLPVAVALGDNQASFIGSVPAPWESVLVNMGTGGQVSALVRGFSRRPTLDTRAFGDDAYLLVGAGSSGGRTLGYWHELMREIGRELFAVECDDLYPALLAAAAQTPPGAAGVRCVPHLTGTRADPGASASWSGLTVENLHLGSLTRALIEGVADDALAFWQEMQPLAGERRQLVGAGNGLRRNSVLAEALERAFGLPLTLSPQQEAAAVGAALSASVAVGAYSSLWEAMGSV